MSDSIECDLAIVGTGPVACALVSALARRGFTRTLRIALIGPHRAHTPPNAQDPRAIALSHGSRVLLDSAWPAHATPIHQIHISQQGYFGSTTIDRNNCKLPALGYVLRYSALLHTLGKSAHTHLQDLQHLHGPSASGWFALEAGTPGQDGQGVTLPLTPLTKEASIPANAPSFTPTSLRAKLLIYAEGGAPPTHAFSNRHLYDYHQTALIGIVRASALQAHTAWERFTAEGPLALLPLGGPDNTDYALVWCSAPETAQRRLHAPEKVLLAELEAAFASRMGHFLSITDRTCFPLTLQKQQQQVSRRIAAIGNAAQTLHPVAGQGLNLGLRDAWVLAQSLTQGPTPEALLHFAKHRKADRATTIRTTHTLAHAFIASSLSPLPTLYSAGLTMLDHLPFLKTAFANQMIFGKR